MSARKPSQHEVQALIEYSKRRNMALSMFRPLPHQEPIFTSQAKYGLYLGGNRAGKTLCAAVKFAAIAMDMPITFNDGRQVHQRRPHQRGKLLRLWSIAYSQTYIGQTIYRMLFKHGEAFQIIRDLDDGQLRAWRRWEPADAARAKEVKGAPPLIPDYCVDQSSWNWENRGNREFNRVVIVHPVTKEPTAEIFAYSSKGDPKAGDPVDVIWVDERAEYDSHYPEWVARLVDRGGFLYWSSWPSTDNDALVKLHDACMAEEGNENPLHECVQLTMSGNVTLDEKEKNDFLAGCHTEEDRMARDLGMFATEQLRSYPLFDPNLHSAIVTDARDPDQLSKVLEESNGMPPSNWTRYLMLDPGTQQPAIILAAVPPPEFGDYVVIYDELYPGRADPWQLARKIKPKVAGQRFYKFIVDFRAARATTLGMKAGMTVYDSYADAFEKEGMRCASSGSRFDMGSDDVGGRISIVRKWMHLSDKGFPKLRIVTHRCPELCKQLKKVKKQVTNKEESDDRHAKYPAHDLVDCLEYFAAARPSYEVIQQANPAEFSSGYAWYLKKFGNKKQEAPSIVAGPRYRPS